MKSKNWLLLSTLLKSTSSMNVLKHTKDKQKRKNAVNSLVGTIVLDIVLFVFCILYGIGLGAMGFGEALPALCAMVVTLMSFLFTIFKSNGYLFGFKEYDMLMAMPFSVKTIISSKFLYMYINSLPMVILINLAMLPGYALAGRLHVLNCLMWLLLMVILPIIPTVLASALGALIVRFGSGFKRRTVIQTVLTFIVILPLFFVQFFAQKIAQDNSMEVIMENMSDTILDMAKYLPNAVWFYKAINEGNIWYFLLLLAVSAIIYELFFVLVAKSYQKVNSKLSGNTSHNTYKKAPQKQRNMVYAIAYKEFKRMTGSSVYMTNALIGEIMAVILGVAALFFKADQIVEVVMKGAPIEPKVIVPALPIFLYFFLGMVATTCFTPSLEGKNYWIIKTMPIDPMDDVKGKLLFNICLTVPFGLFAMLSLSICFQVSVIEAVMMMLEITCLCLFSSVRGLKCGLKYRRLDWDNEVEVIKQGKAVSIYLLPNMFISMFLMPGVVFLNLVVKNNALIALVIAVIALALSAIIWGRFFCHGIIKKNNVLEAIYEKSYCD